MVNTIHFLLRYRRTNIPMSSMIQTTIVIILQPNHNRNICIAFSTFRILLSYSGVVLHWKCLSLSRIAISLTAGLLHYTTIHIHVVLKIVIWNSSHLVLFNFTYVYYKHFGVLVTKYDASFQSALNIQLVLQQTSLSEPCDTFIYKYDYREVWLTYLISSNINPVDYLIWEQIILLKISLLLTVNHIIM